MLAFRATAGLATTAAALGAARFFGAGAVSALTAGGASTTTGDLLAAFLGARFRFASATGSGGGDLMAAMVGMARSMLRRAGAKLSTTSVTDSPTFMNSRALRGAGSAIRLNGTYPFTSPIRTYAPCDE